MRSDAQRCQRIEFERATETVEVHVKRGLALWTHYPSIVDKKIDRSVPENSSDTVERLWVCDIHAFENLARQNATGMRAHQSHDIIPLLRREGSERTPEPSTGPVISTVLVMHTALSRARETGMTVIRRPADMASLDEFEKPQSSGRLE